MHQGRFAIAPLFLRDAQELALLEDLRRRAFTPWVHALPPRPLLNASARIFHGFFLEARDIERFPPRLCGALFSVPSYWSGALDALGSYDSAAREMYNHPLQKAALLMLPRLDTRIRQRLYGQANSLVLLALLVDPAYTGMHIPSQLLAYLKEAAQGWGYRYLLSPFRPSGYGDCKARGKLAHSRDLFVRYCYDQRPDGLPVDTWLRTLARNGMRMLKPELRSVVIERPLSYFQRFRRIYKPDAWYQSGRHTWECGVTPTFYEDPGRNIAMYIEPNMWGCIDTRKEDGGS